MLMVNDASRNLPYSDDQHRENDRAKRNASDLHASINSIARPTTGRAPNTTWSTNSIQDASVFPPRTQGARTRPVAEDGRRAGLRETGGAALFFVSLFIPLSWKSAKSSTRRGSAILRNVETHCGRHYLS